MSVALAGSIWNARHPLKTPLRTLTSTCGDELEMTDVSLFGVLALGGLHEPEPQVISAGPRKISSECLGPRESLPPKFVSASYL